MSGFVSVLHGAPRVPWSCLRATRGWGRGGRCRVDTSALFPAEQLCLLQFDVLGSWVDFSSAVA